MILTVLEFRNPLSKWSEGTVCQMERFRYIDQLIDLEEREATL